MTSSWSHGQNQYSSTSSYLIPIGLALGASCFAYLSTVSSASAKEEQTALDPKNFKPFTLGEVYNINHNTNRYRFLLEDKNQLLGLNVASCLVVKAPIGEDGKDVIRPYTPVSDTQDRGFFDLVVKTYPAGVMSKHLASLQPGQTLEFKGPFSKIDYKPNMKKRIGMIAGGTGITPMLQVIHEILKNQNDKTEVNLLFANNTEEDVLLKNELDLLALRHSNFKVYYTVASKTTPTWKHDVGFITEDLLKKHLPPPSDGDTSVVFVCGPPGMMEFISGDKAKDNSQGELKGLLKRLGYQGSQVFKF